MIIPELTVFQYKTLAEAAKSPSPIYQLCRPNRFDSLERIHQWTKNNCETDELVTLGLVDNISESFRKQIDESMQQSGRDFRVFRITDLGILLFRASCTAVVN
jgi:hypothetical protein